MTLISDDNANPSISFDFMVMSPFFGNSFGFFTSSFQYFKAT